jgi:hypothetical protein
MSRIENAISQAHDKIAYFSVVTAKEAESIKKEAEGLAFSSSVSFYEGFGGDSYYGVHVWAPATVS